jgi:hypothetical protein
VEAGAAAATAAGVCPLTYLCGSATFGGMARTGWLAVVLLAAACHGTSTVICDAYCRCETCSEAHYDECIHGNDVLDEQAEQGGCSDELDAYLTCAADSATCEGGHFHVDGCLDGYRALAACLEQTPCCPAFDACGRASQKLVACGLSEDGPASSSYCDGIIKCFAECVNLASCDEIAAGVTPAEPTAFSSCFAACGS